MKTIILYFSLFIAGYSSFPVLAQEETFFTKIERLENQKEEVVAEEKAALRNEVEKINRLLENKEIDREEAEELKEKAARKHAQNIQNRVAIIDNQIALLSRDEEERNEISGEAAEADREHDDQIFYKRRNDRTSTHLVIAAGFNNALQSDQSLDDSEFKIGGSRFFEIGWAWRTRVFENSNWLRFRYGVSVQFNGLKPTDNRYFVEDGDLTLLQEHHLDLEKSKFRMDNLVFPVHFELGPSLKVETKDRVWYSTKNKLKVGLGGYAGFNIGERQKLKFSENGEDVKQKLKGGYNTNELIYGLSGYLGWGGTALYMKYDLNPIFDDPNPELYNVSLGLRFDVN